jgi:hypothetical protein
MIDCLLLLFLAKGLMIDLIDRSERYERAKEKSDAITRNDRYVSDEPPPPRFDRVSRSDIDNDGSNTSLGGPRKPSGSDVLHGSEETLSRGRKPDELSSRSRQPDITEPVKAIDLNPSSPTKSERSSVHSKRSKSRSRVEASSSSQVSTAPLDESVWIIF